MDEEKVGTIENRPFTAKESLFEDFTQKFVFDSLEENSMQQQENFKQFLKKQRTFLNLNLLKVNNAQDNTQSDELPELIASDQKEKSRENNIKSSLSAKKSNLKLKILSRNDDDQNKSNETAKESSYPRNSSDNGNSEVSHKKLLTHIFIQQGDTEQYSNKKKKHCRSKHEYLAQLLRDKSQILKFPDAFLHVEKILDKGCLLCF